MNTFDPNHKPSSILFKIGQKIVVFNSENKILFLRRSQKTARAGGWDFPGGGLEYNEQPIDGIKREAKEECEIELVNIRPTTSIVHDTDKPNIKTLIIGYIAQLSSGKVQLGWEHDEFKWLSVNEALNVDLPTGHTLFLKSAIEYFEKI